MSADERQAGLPPDIDTALTLHFRHAHGCGESREFPWECDCGYREHLALVEAALAVAQVPAQDADIVVERLDRPGNRADGHR